MIGAVIVIVPLIVAALVSGNDIVDVIDTVYDQIGAPLETEPMFRVAP